MRRLLTVLTVALAMIGMVAMTLMSVAQDNRPPAQIRAEAAKLQQQGNFKDAYELFRKLCLNDRTEKEAVPGDLANGVQCLRQLGREADFDEFVESTVKVHAKNWKLLQQAAAQYRSGNHYGFIISGKFERGWRRENTGRQVNAAQRDRARGLQLLDEARRLSASDDNKSAVSQLLTEYAQVLRFGNNGSEAWRFQILSNLAELPDYDEGHWWGGRQAQGAPVDENNVPVYHQVPASWEDSKSDGERWRWLLGEAVKFQPNRKQEVTLLFAQFCYEQFGEQTLAQFGWWRPGDFEDEANDRKKGTYALQSLEEDETIAKLATGVRRFKLPDEYNFLKLFRDVVAMGKSNYGEQAWSQIAGVFQNRRQYVNAAETWRKAIAEYGPGPNNHRQASLDQIINNWGRFEPTRTLAAGKEAVFDYRFRNGKSVAFEATRINVPLLLKDVKDYLTKAMPERLDWNKIQLGQIGHRLVVENESKYLEGQATKWQLDLKPRAEHLDDRAQVTTPLQDPGAYLIKAQMQDGNANYIVLWIADTVIAKKPLDQQQYVFIADAETGRPVVKANVEFFGWRNEQIPNTNRFRTVTSNFAEFTDADGQILLAQNRLDQNMQWLITSRGENGKVEEKKRLAFLGFTHIWFGQRHDAEYSGHKVFTITDRPVYRPEQTVQFKLWLREHKYDQPDKSQYANQNVNVFIQDPQGKRVFEKTIKTDEFGGVADEFKLPKTTGLGVYQLVMENYGGSSFRVEEYKKPEFEVIVEAPTEPVQLGEKITATIKAKYYFGAPVTKGKVKYTVRRSNHDARWFPRGDWDWFYGSGYWWFAADYTWYPGWGRWGCLRPIGWWWPAQQLPPEVVIERETEIGDDGIIKVEIDTLLAKEVHGNQDHNYSITAEVVDESRRTIVGSGSVLVARKPFKVFAWVNRGYFRTGDAIEASFQAHTLDQKPVAGEGELKLLRVTYNDGEPVENIVGEWKVATNEEGRARQQMKAGDPGQYRLSYKVTDAKGHTEEGGYIFTIVGANFTGREFKFNDLELITDKREYAPGESVKLQINTDRQDGTVALFLRPANGIYLKPKIIRLQGKSTVEDIGVVQRDMPNFFIEALSVSNAQVHSETREIVVPPEKRVLNVEITPSTERYKPGEDATVDVRVTDQDDKPFAGVVALSVYDKSVEYISGGSNVPEIKEFFWKWRRHHHPQTESSLIPYSHGIGRPNVPQMGDIGLFGGIVDDLRDGVKTRLGAAVPGRGRSMMKSAMAGDAMEGARPMAATAAAPGGPPMDRLSSLAEAEVAKDAGPAGGAPTVEPAVRSNFADTAFWAASLTTGKDGRATAKFKMPDSLTSWKMRAWGMGHGTKVGQGDVTVVTAKNLLVRLQAPRFFVEKDEVVLSANVHNYLDKDKDVKVALELDNTTLKGMVSESGKNDLTRTVKIKAGGEERIDWRVKVAAEGQAVVRMKALTDTESDAVEQKFPCFVHGMLKTESFSGVVRPDEKSGSLKLNVPAERRPEQTRLELRYSPTLAGAMVDALPYLVDYPYGCTEQTLNRFVPTVITQRILQKMNLDLDAIREKRTNLNAQEIGDDKERAGRWKKYDRNPVFDAEEVTAMVKDGVQKLTSMQLSDGGWGWFSGFGEHSWPHTTVVVVHGLQVATQNDVALVPGVLERGVEWLKRYEDEQVQKLKNAPTRTSPWKEKADDLDAMIFLTLNDAKSVNTEMRAFLYRDRVDLSVYAKAVLGLALHKQERIEERDMLLKNIEQFVVEDDENQTAYLKLPANTWWWMWYGNDIEANAWYLKLLSATDPQGRRASRLVKYILNNRHNGTYWRSTRDTAYCIEALADYLKASGEAKPDMTVEVVVDGAVKKTVKIDHTNLFHFDNKLVLEGDALANGEHTVEIRRTGTGPVYFNAYLTNFTLEDFITKAGLEVKVQRKFFNLTRDDKQTKVAGARGQVVNQRTEKFIRTELPDLSKVKSGDLIEVELDIDSKNDYEYILFEDMKAAGTEPVEVRSGYNGNEMHAYVEYRDERVCLFVRALNRGHHSVSYRIRAEIPGKFSALPTKASAMYSPELKANSDEMRLLIED